MIVGNFYSAVVVTITILLFQDAESIKLITYISQNGLHGEIEFSQKTPTTIQIETKIETTLEFPEQTLSWAIHEFPVDYTELEDRCAESKLGKQIINLDDTIGYLQFPGNESSTWEVPFNLTGSNAIWGKSIVLTTVDSERKSCGTITSKDKTIERVAEAHFYSPIAGSVYFRWIASKGTPHIDTLIHTDLYHVQDTGKKYGKWSQFTEHSWKIYVTDIFDSENDKSEENCNILQLVFDPENAGKTKAIGDIDERIGKVRVSADITKKRYKTLFRDTDLSLLPTDLLGPQRRLYLVIFDPKHPDSFLACAKIRHRLVKTGKTTINANGIKGVVTMTQHSRFEPTWLNFTIGSSNGQIESNLKYASSVASFKIHHLPPTPSTVGTAEHCYSTGDIYNPRNVGEEGQTIPPSGLGTQEQYPAGDLSGKLKNRNREFKHNYLLPGETNELDGIYWDLYLPLEGKHSIIHRGLVVDKYDPNAIQKSEPWLCGIISLYEPNGIYQTQMFTAQVLFRYPIVGRILFRQPSEQPWVDTTILVEYLVHADGSTQNNSMDHRWAVHEIPPGKDFYNWTMRCLSSGHIFNPYKVVYDAKEPSAKCATSPIGLCRLGDLSTRLGTFSIAGRKLDGQKLSRKLFTDSLLPLGGVNSILGRSLVLYDDHGPVARGERLACSIISGVYRRKAVARDWFGNGSPLQVKGKMEIIQQTEYDQTNVEVELDGLSENSGYHVHITPVEADLEFPCEGTSLYGHWNPLKVIPRESPPPGNGSTDQYEMGDLSGKFGTLEGYTKFRTSYNDTQLPLFGENSILGRSIVIHKKEKMLRWACSTLERGYSPSEARELRAIASFHHPAGYAYGYVRMTQLIHRDGSQSDTIVEVKLRYPGENDRNKTRNHNWAIYVNPVGVDAAVPPVDTRCVAGGYMWNPYYTQLADPLNDDLYRQECGPDNPLRCYVGDMSARLGTIDLGYDRQVFTDSNLPLEGKINIMGRSIVIFGPEKAGYRFACANIEPDHDIIKFVNLRKPPKFVVAQFLSDIRHVMGLPEWMLAVDSRKTLLLHNGGCVQIVIHFKGPHAIQLDIDFTRLISSGRLDNPSISIPGYVDQKRRTKVSYRTCGTRDPSDRKAKNNIVNFFTRSGANIISFNTMIVIIPLIILKLVF